MRIETTVFAVDDDAFAGACAFGGLPVRPGAARMGGDFPHQMAREQHRQYECTESGKAAARGAHDKELEQAADFLDACKGDMEPLARALASQIGDTPLVVHGANLTTAPARRWANQFNENAKQLAFSAEIPEANHNLMEAWSKGSGGLGAVFLTDSGQSPRERRRMELTAEAVDKTGAPVFKVETLGETRSERLFWAVMFGDLVSVEVAALRGVDPLPVDEIQNFKRRLGKT